MIDFQKELGALITPVNKEVQQETLDDNYTDFASREYPEVLLKEVGDYVFYVCPPFQEWSQETPWGGRLGLIVKKHYNLPREDGKVNGVILDAEGSFPWLGQESPLNKVLKKWSDNGMSEAIKDNTPGTGVYFNVLLLKSPDAEHKPLINLVDKDGNLTDGAGKPKDHPTISVLLSNMTTFKELNDLMQDSLVRYDISDPLHGSMIKITKEVKTVKGRKRTNYKRLPIPNSPMWFDGMSDEDKIENIKYVLGNLHDLYELFKPSNFHAKDINDYATRLNVIMEQKFSSAKSSNALSDRHTDDFAKMPQGMGKYTPPATEPETTAPPVTKAPTKKVAAKVVQAPVEAIGRTVEAEDDDVEESPSPITPVEKKVPATVPKATAAQAFGSPVEMTETEPVKETSGDETLPFKFDDDDAPPLPAGF